MHLFIKADNEGKPNAVLRSWFNGPHTRIATEVLIAIAAASLFLASRIYDGKFPLRIRHIFHDFRLRDFYFYLKPLHNIINKLHNLLFVRCVNGSKSHRQSPP